MPSRSYHNQTDRLRRNESRDCSVRCAGQSCDRHAGKLGRRMRQTLQLLVKSINKRQCGMQRQQLPQKVLCSPQTDRKRLLHEIQSDAR